MALEKALAAAPAVDTVAVVKAFAPIPVLKARRFAAFALSKAAIAIVDALLPPVLLALKAAIAISSALLVLVT